MDIILKNILCLSFTKIYCAMSSCVVLATDDDTMGQEFHSKYYPSLKHFIHTGFDLEFGEKSFNIWLLISLFDYLNFDIFMNQ